MKAKVKINELENIINALFHEMNEKLGGDVELELAEDYYWDIDKDERYDVTNKPKDLSLGQLYEDWYEVSSIMKNNKNFVSHDLVKLASLLRYIGENSIW